MNTPTRVTPLTAAALSELSAVTTGPCLSLYQPTHRHHPDSQQDPIRYREGVKALQASLLLQHPSGAVREWLEPFQALAEDESFWQHTLDGLAVLAAPGLFRVFHLQRSVPELAIAADSLHTKPLRRWLQSVDRYQVLGLSRHRAQLFEGDRNQLTEIDLSAGVPASQDEALDEASSEPNHTGSDTGGVDTGQGSSNATILHGQGGKKNEVDGDTDRYFRAVDQAVMENYSVPSGLPLLLATLPEHQHRFRELSRNTLLSDAALLFDPQGLPIEELRERAWLAVEPLHRARQAAWCDAFATAQAHGLGSAVLADVSAAAAAGRVEMLLIESGRQIGGRLDRSTGAIETAGMPDPDVDDLLDDLAELVQAMGGQVKVLAAERMPVQTGLAATYRY